MKDLNKFVLDMPVFDDDGCTYSGKIIYHYPKDDRKVMYLHFFRLKTEKIMKLYDLQTDNM